MTDGSIPNDVARRIWGRDDSLWAEGEDRPSDRLGWLTLPTAMREHLADLHELAHRVSEEGYQSVALLGMGGSSLAPELFASLFQAARYPNLVVVDSTHPDQVRHITDSLDLNHTLFCVASKSGTTAETLALYHHFRQLVPDGARFLAISDPETHLVSLARETGFRAIFENPPDIGGRYSALSLFGLVPGGLVGADLEALLDTAGAEASRSQQPDNAAAQLGSSLASAVAEGRDKLTFYTSPSLALFGDWVEQLLAESTGKQGTGVVPIVSEPEQDQYGSDRVDVSLKMGYEEITRAAIERRLQTHGDVGAELFHWEFATAVAGVGLGVNPFDQPDVEAAKRAARAALDARGSLEWPDDNPDELFAGMEPPAYAAVLAFAPSSPENREVVQRARHRLGASYGVATVGAFGPRYLHSSGQLHKGGPKRLRALVVLLEPVKDLPIPGEEHTFGRLVRAQAAGDAEALRSAGQRVGRITWDRFAEWATGA